MTRKPISVAEVTRYRVTIVTLDNHLASAVDRARRILSREIAGLELHFHAAADWNDPAALEACRQSIAKSDIVVATMLFMEEHAEAVLPAMKARRDNCDAMLGCMSAPAIVKLTRVGRLDMSGSKRGAFDFLKKLRGGKSPSDTGGAAQLAMLRRIPKILRFIPGPAQDLRTYFLTLQYWLAGSDENVANLVRFLVNRYAGGAHAHWRGTLRAVPPAEYPDVGVYHPRLPGRVSDSAKALPAAAVDSRGVVGLLLMRSYILANNTAHYDAVIAAFEAKGLRVIPVFASGLDARPAARAFFFDAAGRPCIDAFVSLTGFSLVGGPAYNDCRAAADLLGELDVPYIAAHALEFQTLEQWEASERGLLPVENTIMVAIPELDGAIAPTVFGGRTSGGTRDLQAHPERVGALAERVSRMVRLRKTPRAERRLAIVLFNFPPNGGAAGTAAFLGVYASLLNTLRALRRDGYDVEVPANEDALRKRILEGNAARFGAAGNVCARIPVDDHVRRERHLKEIEAQWGPAPGRHQTDGRSLHVIGERFGNVLVTLQPAFGYEGDPMRLLFERGFSPTHAFSAQYRYLREDFAADAILHFGMHGALEFMPGKQSGMSAACWPERLIGATPNIYLYAANNPAEGALAKRRSAATLVSYLTPSLSQAGLYRGLLDLKASLERYRASAPEAHQERCDLATLIQSQAANVDLSATEPAWGPEAPQRIARLVDQVLELEYALIPHGLHVVGEIPSAREREDTLTAIAETAHNFVHARTLTRALMAGEAPDAALRSASAPVDETTTAAAAELAETARLLAQEHELPALLRALDGRFIAPVAGGDLLRTPAILPTGRNLHGFDPYRIPSAFALADGRRQAERVLARYCADQHATPETVAVVLWGADNLKSEGGPIAQALALVGAKPRFDPYNRLCGAELDPAGGARPAAHRRRRDAVRHLPRSAAAADPVAGRGVLAGGDRGRARGHELRAQARAGVPGRTRLRSRDRGAAGVLQRRRGLRRQCRHADRLRRLERRGRDLQHLRAAQGLRLLAARRGERSARTARRGAAHRRLRLSEPRQHRAWRHFD